ncbi:MAG: PPE family protein [Mycobacterium sp.]|uniref:PPE family protein n=1 Tax=Mycobacterium sp. TaxID=1785 RepID=UPI003C5F1761
MEFTTLPPEVTSALIHAGPGAESLIEASGAWQQLGTNLEDSAENCVAALSSLNQAWHGPSAAAMTQAVEPYLSWLQTTAQQCQQTAASAMAAAAAFNSVRGAVVPTAQVAANRMQLVQLLATDRFGSNLPAIAETEAQYQTMWANNSAAMGRYQAASAQASTLPQFSSPSSVINPTGVAAQASALPAATTSAAAATTADATTFDPSTGWSGLANTYANQFISSGFPINLLSYLAQSQSAQALQGVNSQIGQGVSEGESALGGGAAGALGGLGAGGFAGLGPGALGAAGLGEASTTAATGVGVSIGRLTAPPAVVGLLPSSQVPVQLASAATPLGAGESGLPMLPPIMPPPISPAGSGWRKRKQQKYEDIAIGAELKGTVMRPPPSAG